MIKSKRTLPDYTRGSVWRRFKDEKEKKKKTLMSRARKEILTKSAAQAKPSY